jgi:hypothetical protein
MHKIKIKKGLIQQLNSKMLRPVLKDEVFMQFQALDSQNKRN